MFILNNAQWSGDGSSFDNFDDNFETANLKLESYFLDLDRVRNSIFALNSGFKDNVTLAFIEENLSTLKNNYGSFIRSESHLDVYSRLKYRAENIFKTIWEKIVAFWNWIINKIKNIFGSDTGSKEEAASVSKDNTTKVDKIKDKSIPITPEVKHVVENKLKNVTNLPKEKAVEVTKALNEVAEGKSEGYKNVSEALEEITKNFNTALNKKDEEKKKEEERKLKEKEEQQKIEKGLNIKLKDKLFNLDSILSGTSYRLPETNAFHELVDGVIDTLEIFRGFKKTIERAKKFENLSMDELYKVFFNEIKEKGSDINFKKFNENKNDTIIYFLGSNKHLVITIKDGVLKTKLRSYTETVVIDNIDVKSVEAISRNLSTVVSTNVDYSKEFLKISEEIKELIKSCENTENKNLQKILSQISSSATIIPQVVSHLVTVNKQSKESLKQINKFVTIIKDAGL